VVRGHTDHPKEAVLNVVDFCYASPTYNRQQQRAVILRDHLESAHPTGEELLEHQCRAADGEQPRLLEEDGLLEPDGAGWLLTGKKYSASRTHLRILKCFSLVNGEIHFVDFS